MIVAPVLVTVEPPKMAKFSAAPSGTVCASVDQEVASSAETVNAAAHGTNLQACGGCDVQYAQQLGADLAITGVVQKVSNLILNMNIYLRDTHTGHLVTSMNADFRGNTDESWSRAASYLLRNRLLAPNYGAPQ